MAVKNYIYNSLRYLVPQLYFEKMNLMRKIRFYREKKIIFIHVPKAAGTSVANALYGKTLGHFKAKMIMELYPKEFSEFFTFAIVRNPYSRVISAYKFVKQGGTEYMGVAKKSVYKSKLFSSFDIFVKEWLSKVDLSNEDYVFQPQYLFTHDEYDRLLVDKIWQMEGLDLFQKEFSEETGIQLNIKHLNRSKKSEIELNDELKQIIYEVYKKDFELFGYEK